MFDDSTRRRGNMSPQRQRETRKYVNLTINVVYCFRRGTVMRMRDDNNVNDDC